ncbi:hypothetical protein [Bdellovibrio sp. HCB337]|uniref:hypothetical protein n=1 Tax=Bdellovibrio sp. HCB337 TaxID=3394358 RepID=UPI0039A599DA
MLQKIITRGLSVGVLTILLACSDKGGFSAQSLPGTDNNGSSSTDGGNDNTPVPNEYQKLQYKGFVSGGNNDGSLVIDIDKTANALLIILPLQMNPYIDSAEGEIPDLPGVKFMTYKDDKGASFFAVSVPLRYVLKGASFLNPARLPNGDPLPQVASGELPSLALAVPGKNNVKFHFYIGVNVVGVYVSSPYDPYLPLHFPIRRGVETIGYFHTVPAKSGFDGGFFLNTQMPDSVAAIIDDHFRF